MYKVFLAGRHFNDCVEFHKYIKGMCPTGGLLALDKGSYILMYCDMLPQGGKIIRVHDLPTIKKGEVKEFYLKANPVEGIDIKKPIKDTQKLLDWINRKASENGFKIDILKDLIIGRPAMGYKNGNDKPLVFNTVHYYGVLSVFDDEKFNRALKKGIGRAKRFGFGLLQLMDYDNKS